VIRISFRTMAGALLALSLLWIVNGCSQTSMRSVPPPHDRPVVVHPPAPATPESPYVHVVRWHGETLSSIAAWYTASWQNWQALARANPKIDPNRIEIGQKIRIPEALLKTRKPMPSDSLPAPAVKETVRPTPSREAPAKPALRFYVHVVQWQNETLSFIAEWYTASWQNWETLAKANPKIDPNRIKIGQKIRIPEALLKTREPMPSDSLPKAVSKKSVQPAAPSREPVEKPDRVRAIKVGETSDKPKTRPPEVELFAPEEPKSQPIVVSEMELFEPEEIAGKPAEIPEETGLFGPLE
jgi:LysM repeat protein